MNTILLLLLAQFTHARQPLPQYPQPNVVIFFADDVALDDLDGVDTPNIDVLASQGTEFRRGYAQPKCAPSRISMMQSEWRGTTPGLACTPNSPRTIPHGRSNMVKSMEGAGYDTTYLGRWGLGGNIVGDPDDYAWTPQLWGWSKTVGVLIDGNSACIPGGNYFMWEKVDDGVRSVTTTYLTEDLVNGFTSTWPAMTSPKVAFAGFNAAHDPFHWPPTSAMPPGWVQPTGPTTKREQYEAMIQSIDWAVGEMMAHVDLSTTMVFFIGDNGTPPQVAPIGLTNRVKFSTFERGVKVPFIVAGLGFPAGRISQALVSTVDVVPTMVDLANGIVLSEYDGQSILPLLVGGEVERHWVYVQESDTGDRAIIENVYKYRRNAGGGEIIYNLQTDPTETNGVFAASFGDPVVLERLRAEMDFARSTP